MARNIRVLVVDDSVVVRRLVGDVLSAEPGIEVVGTASNGRVALARIDQLNPDLVTLDVEMPVMDGLETLRHLRSEHPHLPVVMFSTLTERGAAATLDALELGARDYVTKPANVGSVTASVAAVRDQLVPKIRGLCGPAVPPSTTLARTPLPYAARSGVVDVLAIGASTGGPDALTTVLTSFPADFPVPVVVVQHMPAVFTRHFAERLDAKTALSVSEATPGALLRPGSVLVAAGDHHLRFARVPGASHGVVAALDQGTPENYCRPAVDVTLRSVVDVWGGHVLAAVLTGMGSDGASGAAEVVAAGGSVVVQDRDSSVVWGMPGAVLAAGVPADVLPLARIGPALLARVTSSSPTRSTHPREVVPS